MTNQTTQPTLDHADRAAVLDGLGELIAIPTTRGHERPGMEAAAALLRPYVDDIELRPVPVDVVQDPLYAFPVDGLDYTDAVNLVCTIKGSGRGAPVVLNTHMDVVPPSEGQQDAYRPRVEGSIVHGRGACDAKGQVAVMHALAMLYRRTGPPPVDVVFHVVIEEENGGNGTLALVRDEVEAQAVVVLEPSNLDVFAAVRGAVWFRLSAQGKAGHSGSGGERISALDSAIEAMGLMRRYHDALLERSRGNPLFDQYPDPMPITFGRCTAGAWPASIPSAAVVEGVLGFLPPLEHPEVQAELREVLRGGSDWLRDTAEITFPMLNNDGFARPTDDPLVVALHEAARAAGADSAVDAMTASCDAWQYNNLLGIPTVVFGAGSLAHAHGKDEQVDLDDVAVAATALHGTIERLGR